MTRDFKMGILATACERVHTCLEVDVVESGWVMLQSDYVAACELLVYPLGALGCKFPRLTAKDKMMLIFDCLLLVSHLL